MKTTTTTDTTTTATHTPGPWRFDAILTASESHRGWSLSRDHAGFGGYIGTVSPKIKDDRGCASAEGLANARLIAAAPELLGFCKTAEVEIRNAVEVLQNIDHTEEDIAPELARTLSLFADEIRAVIARATQA